MRAVAYDTDDVVAAWVELVRTDAGHDIVGLRALANDLVRSLAGPVPATVAALEAFGSRVGADGWPLDQVSRWLNLLAAVAPHHATVLRSFAGGSAVAMGWAASFVRGATERIVIDPASGLSTPAVLTVRVHHLYALCADLGIPTHLAHAIGVIDVARDATGLVAAAVGRAVSSVFRSGETCAWLGGRVAVLDAHTSRLGDKLRQVEDVGRADAVLAQRCVITWIEELPQNADDLDAYLADLMR